MFIAPTLGKSFAAGAGGIWNSGYRHVTPGGVKTKLRAQSLKLNYQKSPTAPVVALLQVAHTCSRRASCLSANVETGQCA